MARSYVRQNVVGIAAFIHPRHFAEGTERLIEQLAVPDKRAEIRSEMEGTDGWENWYRHVGFDWGRVIVGKTSDSKYDGLIGKSVAEIASTQQEDAWESFFKLVKASAFVLPQSMTEANKILAMQQDFVSFCTDVGPAGGDSFASHPRAYGSFPGLLSTSRRLGSRPVLRRHVPVAQVCPRDERGGSRETGRHHTKYVDAAARFQSR